MLSFLFSGGKTEIPSGNITLLGLAMQESLTWTSGFLIITEPSIMSLFSPHLSSYSLQHYSYSTFPIWQLEEQQLGKKC